MDDITRFKPGQRGSQEPDETMDDRKTAMADDRSQFSTRKSGTADQDKTRLKRAAIQAPDTGDHTRFTPPARAAADDRTRVQPAARAGQKAAQKTPQAIEDSHGLGVLKNRFVFEEVLGAGGMGIVYKARDLLKVEAQDRDPYVAIKVLSDEFRAHPEAFIALQRESRKTQRIAHPNIVNVYDFDRDGETVFMTMEFLDGTPLDKLISQYRSVGLPADTIWQILEGICAALIYAHEQNIIHSDFKPGNIFVTSNGTAKVFDFGIARAVAKAENREESKDDRTVFDAGSLGALTPAYASLEMLEGDTPDERDDVYALGCIAYELFTGEHPYNRMHADEARRQKIKPKRISGISKGKWRAIERALAFKREDRSESVAAFWREFTRKVSHRGKLSAALFVAFGVAGAVGFYQYMPEERSAYSEDQFRSQIERDLRIEMKKESLALLYATAEFTPAWEGTVWADVQELRELLGPEDSWLPEREVAFYTLYLQAIEKALEADQLEQAQSLAVNARRYSEDITALEALESRIEQGFAARKQRERDEAARQRALAEQRRAAAQQAEVVEQRKTEFDAALANVNRQLQCHTGIDMKDMGIAIDKLRDVDARAYASEEPRITRVLATCIEQIGAAFPERAEDARRDALRMFPRNAVIAGINIVARDPCGLSLAGAGARGRGATCSDRMAEVANPPVMVVIPGAGNIKPFAIGQFEVTVAEFNTYCAASGQCSAIEQVDKDLPAHNIALSNVQGYLRWLSEKSGRRYRLPTRAEWQHAARADGKRIDSNRNCRLNSRGISKGNTLVKSSVGQKNSWGLVNHLGNAQEWVTDRGGRYLAVGGSFETPMNECTLDYGKAHSGDPDPVTGFRVLREVDS